MCHGPRYDIGAGLGARDFSCGLGLGAVGMQVMGMWRRWGGFLAPAALPLVLSRGRRSLVAFSPRACLLVGV